MFLHELDKILNETFDKNEYRAAVAIVQYRDKWLLGLARNTGDAREGRWVHPGGHIKPGETPEQAAVRECWEETGIRCKAVGKAFTHNSAPKDIAFVHCRINNSNYKFKNNHEFTALGLFRVKDMKALKLYKNVLDLIKRVSRE